MIAHVATVYAEPDGNHADRDQRRAGFVTSAAN